MLKQEILQSLPSFEGPILTTYLDTDAAEQSNRGPKPGYLVRLASQAKLLRQSVPIGEQELFRKQADRCKDYLMRHPPRGRTVVIFSGKDCWRCVSLQTKVEEEMRWGAAAMAQLLWLLEEHKRYGVVVPGRKRARFFVYWLGEVRELAEKEFRLEPSKKKEMGPVARPGVRLSRGTNRDVFEHHVAAEYAHFCREIAERIERWNAAEQLEAVFLVGLARMVTTIQKSISANLSEKIVLVEQDLGWFSCAEIARRVEPLVVKHKREYESAFVQALLNNPRNAVVGMEEVLAQLQEGKTHTVIVTKGLNGDLQQCVKCSWVDRTSDPVCPSCGGSRTRVEFRDVLPKLVRRYNVSLEIVSRESAGMLQKSGGIGALLREFEKKEYSALAAGGHGS